MPMLVIESRSAMLAIKQEQTNDAARLYQGLLNPSLSWENKGWDCVTDEIRKC